jgi:hypothetical protein
MVISHDVDNNPEHLWTVMILLTLDDNDPGHLLTVMIPLSTPSPKMQWGLEQSVRLRGQS